MLLVPGERRGRDKVVLSLSLERWPGLAMAGVGEGGCSFIVPYPPNVDGFD